MGWLREAKETRVLGKVERQENFYQVQRERDIYTVCKRTGGLVSGGAVVRANEGVAEESQWKT